MQVSPPLVIYEDNDLLALDKPAGISVLELQSRLPQATLVHRLDRGTSGLILAAKHPAAREYLRELFRARRIEKTYLALVCGVVRRDEALIDLPIGRSAKDPRRRVASAKAFGRLRSARTHFRVLERFSGLTLLEVKPETGRTHQIRVHLKAFGYPIAGDELYGAPGVAPGMRRLALHAARLVFPNRRGETTRLAAPLPEDFAHALALLREKC